MENAIKSIDKDALLEYLEGKRKLFLEKPDSIAYQGAIVALNSIADPIKEGRFDLQPSGVGG